MRGYERASTLFTSNRPVEDWGKLLGDNATVAAMLDRLLHHAHDIRFEAQELANQNGGLEKKRATCLMNHSSQRSNWPGLRRSRLAAFDLIIEGEKRLLVTTYTSE